MQPQHKLNKPYYVTIPQAEWDALSFEQQLATRENFEAQRDAQRVVTSEDRKAALRAENQKPDTLTRLIAFVNKLVEVHNELEKRVEALERGKQSENVPLRPL